MSALDKMRRLYDVTRRNRLNYRNMRTYGDRDAGIEAAACAIREEAIIECMMIEGLPKDEALAMASCK